MNGNLEQFLPWIDMGVSKIVSQNQCLDRSYELSKSNVSDFKKSQMSLNVISFT